MRYLIVGAGGMLGHDLQQVLADREVTALTRAELDVTDADAVAHAVHGRDVVINAAAYTRVDDAEAHEQEAYETNAQGAKNIATATAGAGAKLVQISTDYVFDGSASSPYREDGPVHPISAYGRSKAAGEELALAAHPHGTYIVRTAWLYGAHGSNFAKTMVRLAQSNETVQVVDDQRGQPTWTADLAHQIVALLDSGAPVGVYHGTSSGQCTWFDFARAIFEELGLNPGRVLPTDSAAFTRPAPRPAYSVLGHERWDAAGLQPIRGWREALTEAAHLGVLKPHDSPANHR